MLTLPEVRVLTRQVQTGTAKLGIVAVDAKTKQALGEGGNGPSPSQTQQLVRGGSGSVQDRSIHGEVERMTSGPAAMMRDQLPATVSFSSPIAAEPLQEPELQYTTTQASVESDRSDCRDPIAGFQAKSRRNRSR